ncbi:TetR/AcrR family transcriptional regulator [Pseudonocardia xishanensis]
MRVGEAVEIAAGGEETDRLGLRALRTRDSILRASRALFLERGYAGTRIANITDACGISRAGFYTYFQGKREVFNLLGEAAQRDGLKAISAWDALPHPCSRRDIADWVRLYFDFLDVHGPMIFSAHTAPDEDDVREAATRMALRVSFVLGVGLRSRQRTPTQLPEVLGLAVKAMLDRSWHQIAVEDLPIDREDVIGTAAAIIHSMLDG